MSLLRKHQPGQGLTHVVKQGECGLKKAVFDLLKLEAGASFTGETGTNEAAFIIMSGSCNFTGTDFRFDNIGKRSNVFSGKPTAVYLPAGTSYEIVALNGLEIGICSAASELKSKPVLIGPEEVLEKELGTLSWTRKAYFIIDQRTDSQNLFIGETLISPGKWAFPPHRHDKVNPPEEVDMEEIYHFRVNPPTGFGIQMSYNDDKTRDEAYVVRDGDTVILPDGYHPAAASPVDSLYLLWIMAGEKRIFLSRPEDNYSWVIKCENLLKAK